MKILWGVLRNFIPHWHFLGEVAAHGRRYVCTIGEQVADGNQRAKPRREDSWQWKITGSNDPNDTVDGSEIWLTS